MLITKIEAQKKDPDRVSVYIDGAFAFGMKNEDAFAYGLTEGAELSEADRDKIIGETALVSARDAAVKYLSYRMRSRREIEKYLAKKGFSDAVTDETVGALTKYNYINDLEFARAYIADCLRFNKWGMKKIRYELALKGVAGEVADEAATNAEYSSDEVLIGLIEKKLGGRGVDETDWKEKRKLFGYLMNRGFSYDEISAAYKKFTEPDE